MNRGVPETQEVHCWRGSPLRQPTSESAQPAPLGAFHAQSRPRADLSCVASNLRGNSRTPNSVRAAGVRARPVAQVVPQMCFPHSHLSASRLSKPLISGPPSSTVYPQACGSSALTPSLPAGPSQLSVPGLGRRVRGLLPSGWLRRGPLKPPPSLIRGCIVNARIGQARNGHVLF